MTTLQFIASLVKSLVWPLAIVGIALLFKSQIAGLIDRLKNIKIPGVGAEIELSEKIIGEANEVLDENLERERLDPPMTASDKNSISPDSRFDLTKRLAETSPKAAMTLAWYQLENEAGRTMKELGEHIEELDAVAIFSHLVNKGYVEPEILVPVKNLKLVSNSLKPNKGETSIETRPALNYLDACQKLIAILKYVAENNVHRSMTAD